MTDCINNETFFLLKMLEAGLFDSIFSHIISAQVTLAKYLYDVEANRPFLPSHHAENLATKIGCTVDINEDDRINKDFYHMALKRMKVSS